MIQFELPEEVMNQVYKKMLQSATQAYELASKKEALPFWMKKSEAAEYANVSPNTLKKFIKDGLRVSIKGGIERISKKAIDDYYLDSEI